MLSAGPGVKSAPPTKLMVDVGIKSEVDMIRRIKMQPLSRRWRTIRLTLSDLAELQDVLERPAEKRRANLVECFRPFRHAILSCQLCDVCIA